ncbi:MAG: glycosyltransferase family 39 protein [Thermoguttaceae bacterium]|nr:glycosyltransferase family 39 protein [Thermoguttaceae bacterium]MDW8038770.1 glycosyltransferase family 39 protein [Thermoguttaceae bacterium]
MPDRTEKEAEGFPWRSWLEKLWPYGVATLVALVACWPSLFRQEIDGIDEAQNLMGGWFFVDFLRDLPLSNPIEYGFEYYAQYPALGFVFWPPLFHFVEGLFFLLFGFSLVVGRWCLASFAIGFSWGLVAVCKRRMGSLWGALTAGLILTIPLLAALQNVMLLEIPALAMMMLLLWLYCRMIERGGWSSWQEAVVVAFAAAAAIYTKQTTFFLPLAFLLHVSLVCPRLWRDWRSWVAGSLFVILCIPLLWFTWNYGAANLAQSLGNLGNIFVAGHRVAPRWSWTGWTYYARIAPQVLGLGYWLLGAGALAWVVVRRTFWGRSLLWLLIIVVWYLVFSFFDNKQPRFTAFVLPFIILLGVEWLSELSRSRAVWRATAAAGLALLLAVQCVRAVQQHYTGISGVEPIVRRLLQEDGAGNIAYFGHYRQMFVPFVRAYDLDRQRYVLQGDDITEESGDLLRACREFRVRWLLLDAPKTGKAFSSELEETLGSNPQFRFVRQETFGTPHFQIPLIIYEYLGPVADQMKPVPLRSDTLGIYYR